MSAGAVLKLDSIGGSAHHRAYDVSASNGCFVFPRVVTRRRSLDPIGRVFCMSALVILECNSCGAISPPHLNAETARECEAPDGWTVAIDGEDLDYCKACTAPADRAVAAPVPGRLDEQLVDRAARQPVDAGAGGQLEEPIIDAGCRHQLRLARTAIDILGNTLRAIATAGPHATAAQLCSIAWLGALHADNVLSEVAE